MSVEEYWYRDDIQLTRLLVELKTVGLTAEQIEYLKKSMKLTSEQIQELFDRAEETYGAVLTRPELFEYECAFCSSELEEEE